jgi:hypothetical protein
MESNPVPSIGGKNFAISIKINGAVDISEHPKKKTTGYLTERRCQEFVLNNKMVEGVRREVEELLL